MRMGSGGLEKSFWCQNFNLQTKKWVSMKKASSFKELKKLTFDEPKMEITLLDCNLMTRKVIQYDGNGEFFLDDYCMGFRDEI